MSTGAIQIVNLDDRLRELDINIHTLELFVNALIRSDAGKEAIQSFRDKFEQKPAFEDMTNACYKCKYRGTVPGDAHSCCRHPRPLSIGVVGDPAGIRGGWFVHPFNFDPVWLRACHGFEPKEDT